MKFNKKLVVTSLSTVLGLGIVGSITGTIAWYQYSTRGTASLIGLSAGESGVLQLSADGGRHWKRDVASNDFFYTSRDNIRSDQKTGPLAFPTSGNDYYNGTAWGLYSGVFKYQNINSWTNVYAYVYDLDNQSQRLPKAEWPGIQLSQIEQTANYSFELEKAYKYVIFNDGTEEEQSAQKTDQIEFVSGKHEYDGTNWTGDRVLYFKNTSSWPSVYAYAYTGEYANANKAFPGQQMTLENEGNKVYKVTLNQSTAYDSIMFMDGSNYRSDSKLRPCTWGAVQNNQALPTAGAFGNPVLGEKEMKHWKSASSAVDYFQFTVQLKALDKSSDADGVLVSKEVWLTDIVLKDAGITPQANPSPTVTDALRMHLHVEDGTPENTKNFLIANQAVSGLACHGELDLDGDGAPDKVGGYDWNPNRDDVIDYGDYDNEGHVITAVQTAYGIDTIVATDYDDSAKRYTNGKPLGSTVAQAEGQNPQHYLTITVTVWLEGWATIGENNSAIWGPETLGKTIYAGLSFEVGDKAFVK